MKYSLIFTVSRRDNNFYGIRIGNFLIYFFADNHIGRSFIKKCEYEAEKYFFASYEYVFLSLKRCNTFFSACFVDNNKLRIGKSDSIF